MSEGQEVEGQKVEGQEVGEEGSSGHHEHDDKHSKKR